MSGLPPGDMRPSGLYTNDHPQRHTLLKKKIRHEATQTPESLEVLIPPFAPCTGQKYL